MVLLCRFPSRPQPTTRAFGHDFRPSAAKRLRAALQKASKQRVVWRTGRLLCDSGGARGLTVLTDTASHLCPSRNAVPRSGMRRVPPGPSPARCHLPALMLMMRACHTLSTAGLRASLGWCGTTLHHAAHAGLHRSAPTQGQQQWCPPTHHHLGVIQLQSLSAPCGLAPPATRPSPRAHPHPTQHSVAHARAATHHLHLFSLLLKTSPPPPLPSSSASTPPRRACFSPPSKQVHLVQVGSARHELRASAPSVHFVHVVAPSKAPRPPKRYQQASGRPRNDFRRTVPPHARHTATPAPPAGRRARGEAMWHATAASCSTRANTSLP